MVAALSDMADTVLTGVLILAAAVWLGGFVVIVVVARVARRTLPPSSQVALFRSLGRTYGLVATLALASVYGIGASLLYGRAWDGHLTATAVVATALLMATAVGVAQARRVSRIRRQALDQPADALLAEQIRQGKRLAAALRALIGVLSLAMLALAIMVSR
jgi:uncharacterized membrane protein